MARTELRRFLAVASLAVLLLVAACESAGEARGTRETGLYRLGKGEWRVVGTLRHEDLEGGFWAVYHAAPGEKGGARLAVLRNADELGAKKLEGKYVEATGRIEEGGVSIVMAGPEIDTSTLKEIDTP